MEKKTFRKQITKLFLLIAFIGLVIIIQMNITDRKDTRANMINNMVAENERVSLALDISFNSINELYNFQSFDFTARNILLQDNKKLDEREKFDNMKYMENMLTHVLFMNKILTRAVIISEYGDIYTYGYYITNDYISNITEESKNLGDETKTMYFQPKYYFVDNSEYRLMTMMRNITIYDKNRIGVLFIDIDYDALKNIIMGILQNNTNSNILILNKDEVIYNIDGTTSLSNDKIKSIISCSKEIGSNKYGQCEINKEKYIVTARKNNSTGWTIIQYESENTFFYPSNKEMLLRFSLIGFVFFLYAIMSCVFARKISKPLEMFDQQIRSQNNGKTKMIDLNTKNISKEISNVIFSYNDLTIRINEYIDKTIIYQTNQKIAQMTMLRYQINPHFMFNTLNTIKSLAIINENDEIGIMIDNLSKIMQYNVHGSKCVLLKDEMKMIDSYMIIQKFRFPDSFEVEYNIASTFNNIKIIKFIIQPIVENIFEHGFKNSMNYKGKITISAFNELEDFIIEITDNGIGITHAQLKILEEKLNNNEIEDLEEENIKWNSNIGMLNVHTRLKNYYGKEYGIILNSKEGKDGMETTVRLKMKIM